MRVLLTAYLAVIILTVSSCQKTVSTSQSDTAEQSDLLIPKVTDERSDLVFSWFAEGKAETSSSVSEIPENAKKEVRVQDPNIPPEKADPNWIFIADLTVRNSDGSYKVKPVKRIEYEAQRRAENLKKEQELAAARAEEEKQSASTAPQNMPTITADIPPVIMYATKHCPVCVKARRWLLDQKIPYIEKDLEKDETAAIELQKKGAAQNVSVRGVPVFEIFGKLLPGFDPAQIISMLKQGINSLQVT